MYNENTTWFNQTLYSYRDQIYGSNSSIEMALSCNTNDFNYFTAPNILISIIADSDRSRKSCNLSYTDVIDLILRLRQVQKDIAHAFQSGAEILCKYQRGRTLKFSFLVAESTNENVIQIEIRHNESDFGKIYLPMGSSFLALVKKLETTSNTCDQMAMSLVNRQIMANLLKTNDGMRGDIKSIPGQIAAAIGSGVAQDGDTVNNFVSVTTSEEVEKYTGQSPPESSEAQDSFSGFMDENINNIKVPEIEATKDKEQKVAIREFDSPFINKVLDGKIETLENMLYSSITKPNPFMEFILTIKEAYDVDLLPDFTEADMESYSYISTLIFHTHLQNYSRNSTPLPSTTNILKYKGVDDLPIQNVELLYDLLTVGAYIKIMRERLEDKESDAMHNKAILYLAFRSFSDVLIFSFLDKIDKNAIKTCVMERFNAYKAKGVFNQYEEILASYSCTTVTGLDVDSFITQVIDNIVGKGQTVIEMHDSLYKSGEVILPAINKLSLEQINDLIKLEVEKKLGNFENIDKKAFSDDILELFDEKKKPKAKAAPKKSTPTKAPQAVKEAHVYRLVYKYRNEVPKQTVDALLNYLKDIGTKDVEWEFNSAIEELGENVLKALYVWNESDKKGTFKNFVANNFEQCMLSKDLMLARLKTVEAENKEEVKEDKEEDNWDDIDF